MSNKPNYHNPGQEDASQGKPYNPPHGGIIYEIDRAVRDVIGDPYNVAKNERADREAYDKGWSNTKNQQG